MKKKYFDWKAVVGIVLGVGLLWWSLHGQDPHKLLAEVRRADPFYFAIAVFCAYAVFWIRAWRWKTFLATAAPNSTFKSRIAATTIGFMGNNLLPARVGEFARAYSFAKLENVSTVSSLGSLVIERLFDAIGVIGLLLITLALPGVPQLGGTLSKVVHTLAILIGVGFALGISLVLFPEKTVRFVENHIARFLPTSFRRPLVDALEAFLTGLTVLRSPVLLLTALVQTYILWIFNAVGFWFGFKTFGITAGFTGAMLVQCVVALSVAAPSTPGFFGLFEGASKLVLELYRVPAAKIATFAIGFHLGGFIPVTIVGLRYAYKFGISITEVADSEEVVEDDVESAR